MTAVRAIPRSNPGTVSSRSVVGLGRFERREDGLDGNVAAGHELGARLAQRGGERGRPAVLPDEHGRGRPPLEGLAGVLEVLVGQDAGGSALERPEGVVLADVERDDVAGLVLRDERDVEHADDAAVDEVDDVVGHAGRRHVLGPLEDHVVDRSHLGDVGRHRLGLDVLIRHGSSLVALSFADCTPDRRGSASPRWNDPRRPGRVVPAFAGHASAPPCRPCRCRWRVDTTDVPRPATALAAPEAPAVARDRLRRALCAPRGALLVVLSAPAGYGKTTLLESWAAADPRPFHWARSSRDFGGPRAAGCAASSVPVDALPEPFVLVVDDAHAIASPRGRQRLARTAAALLPGSCLAV